MEIKSLEHFYLKVKQMYVMSGSIKLSTWSVKASTRLLEITAMPHTAASLEFNGTTPDELRAMMNIPCATMLAIVPSTDFFDFGHLCLPNFEPTTLAKVSPMPMDKTPEIKGSSSNEADPVRSQGELWIHSGSEQPTRR